MGMELKAGTRLRSATDACEVVVVKAPGEAIDLRCGGQPFVAIDADVTTQAPAAGFDGGTQLGKRYADEAARARDPLHEGGRRLYLGGRDRPRGQGREAAARVGLSAAAFVSNTERTGRRESDRGELSLP